MFSRLDGLFWLLVLIGPLLFIQRNLHREIQVVFLLITRRKDVSLLIFSMLFLPGVFLHEISHFLMATLLRVRTGKFSLIPHPMQNGRLQLGYVETSQTDVLRDALIGVAPLLTGSLFVIFAGINRLKLDELWQILVDQGPNSFFNSFSRLPDSPDFWLWLYLIFTVSSTMLPSASDRRAWLSITILIFILLGVGLAAGIGEWLLERLTPTINSLFQALAVAIGISLSIHFVLLLPLLGLRYLLVRITGYDVA